MKALALFILPLTLLSIPRSPLHGQADVESEVRSVLQEYIRATNAGDIERLAALGQAPSQLSGGPPAPVREPESCVVTRIVDGDTIDCAPFGRVRLIGMDTPEGGQQPFGDMATEALTNLIPTGTEVLLEPDVEARDRYDRLLGYVWADGILVNWALVRQGFAVLLTYPPSGLRLHRLRR